MKKLLMLLPLLLLVSCTKKVVYYDYVPVIPESGIMVFGTITDKDDWKTLDHNSILYDDVVTTHYAFTVLEDNSGTSYFIQVTKATYEANEVGDEISIIYGGITQ